MNVAPAYLPLRTISARERLARRECDIRQAEFGTHLTVCELGCSLDAIACPEGHRLADRLLAAGSAVHDAMRGWA